MNSIESPLAQQALRNGSNTACITSDNSLTYGELYTRATATGHKLQTEGINNGDRVGILMGNSLELVVLLHACFEQGIVAAPISTRIPSEQLGYRLDQIDADALITDDADRLPMDLKVRALTAREVLAKKSARREKLSDVALDRYATIVFTSGSTGRSKPALHTYENHYFSALGSNENIPVTADDRWMLSLPLYHVGGLAILFRCMLAGGAVVIPDRDESLSDTLGRYGVTHVSLVSTQLRRLLSADLTAVDYLRAMLLGGSAIPDELIEAAYDRGLPIHVSYGLTEMSSQVTTTPPGASKAELRSSGRPLPHRELDIAPDGEILVRGETLFAGYLREGSLNRSRDDEGWFHTRDFGTLDSDGFLHVLGRKDNMFISGGENIQPESIEVALEQLDSIDRAVVVPVSDEEFGHRPVAFVDWHQDPSTLKAIHSTLADVLERFKLPAAIYPLPESDENSGRMKFDRSRLIRYAEARRKSPDANRANQ